MDLANPPSHDLRLEWQALGNDLKRRLIEISLDAAWETGAESDQRQSLTAQGISEDLARWLLETATTANRLTVASLLKSRIERTERKSIDRFNSSLISTGLLIVSLIWLRQEAYLFMVTALPIGALIAGLAVFVLTITTAASWIRWWKSLRRPTPPTER